VAATKLKQRSPSNAIIFSTTAIPETPMSKGMDAKKNQKKKPLLTPEQKKAAKREKKNSR